MAGHAPRESRIRRGKGRGCPQEEHKGAAGRREGGRMGKFPSERRIAPRGAFKRFMRHRHAHARREGAREPQETLEDFRRG